MALTGPVRPVVAVTRYRRSRREHPQWIGDRDAGSLRELLACGHVCGMVEEHGKRHVAAQRGCPGCLSGRAPDVQMSQTV